MEFKKKMSEDKNSIIVKQEKKIYSMKEKFLSLFTSNIKIKVFAFLCAFVIWLIFKIS